MAARVTDGHAHDQSLRTAVGKELPHPVRNRTLAIEPAVPALEIGETRDCHGLVRLALAVKPTNAAIEVATPVIVRTPLGTSSM